MHCTLNTSPTTAPLLLLTILRHLFAHLMYSVAFLDCLGLADFAEFESIVDLLDSANLASLQDFLQSAD
jgi:hypothetical protein